MPKLRLKNSRQFNQDTWVPQSEGKDRGNQVRRWLRDSLQSRTNRERWEARLLYRLRWRHHQVGPSYSDRHQTLISIALNPYPYYFISYSRTTKSFKGWINQTCNIYHIPWALHTWLPFPNSNTKASASSQPSSASSSLPTFSCTLLPTQLPRSIQVSPPIACPWVGTCRCGLSRYRNRYLLLRPECRYLYVSVICVADAILKICDIQPRYEKYTKKRKF